MSEYWESAMGEILDQEDIDVELDTLARIASSVAIAAGLENEYTGVYIQHASTQKENPLKARVEYLEDIIFQLGRRYGVTVDIDRAEVEFLTPCGTAHMGSHSEPILRGG